MIEAIAEWVKAYALPGSPWLLLAGVTAGVALATSAKTRRWGERLLIGFVAGYWLLATPWFSGLLLAGLDSGYSPVSSDPGQVDAIVVLGGGAATYRARRAELQVLSNASAERALEAARLYRLVHPSWVIVSGGGSKPGQLPESRAIRSALIELGVPESVIAEESASGDTYEQALELGPLTRELAVEKIMLVTSPFHMRRALAVFKRSGLDPVPSPSTLEEMDGEIGIVASLLPTNDALQGSELASREYLALVYYWIRGRIAHPWGESASAG